MSAKIYWTPDNSQVISSFIVTRSIDKGVSYQALATIPFNVNGAYYDKQRKQFFYDDGSGDVGYIYSIVASGAAGESEAAFIIVPPDEPAKCFVIGYVRDALGFVDRDVSVHVEAAGNRAERWMRNPDGTLAQSKHAIGITNSMTIVRPDEHGMWSIMLVRKTFCKITIPAIDYVWTFEVPDLPGPINVKDIPQLRGQGFGLFGDEGGERMTLPES